MEETNSKAKLKKLVNNLSELVVAKHTIFSASFMIIALSISLSRANLGIFLSIWKILLSLAALFFARNFAMSFNRICDINYDKTNDRTKTRPSVDGRLSTEVMIKFCVLNALFFIAISYFINDLAFYLSGIFLVILGAYSLMKRFSSYAHLVLGVSLSLAPIAGHIAITNSISLWSIYLSIGVMFWVGGFDILYSIQDIEHDKKEKLYSIPSGFGILNASRISRGFHIITIIFWSLFVYSADLGLYSIIGLIASACLLIYQHYLVSKDLKNIPKAFFNTNGYLGFIFLVFVLIDLMSNA